MHNPYISIITPTKNSEKFIENTLKSVLIQNYGLFEHIIIDSLSTDNTINIIKRYKNFYPLKYISEPDKGISDAFNKGVKLSKGQWIIILGAGDEFISSNILSSCYNILRKKEKKLICWGNVIFKNDKGEVGKHVLGKHNKLRLKQYMCYHHQAIFHNRLLFEKYGYFNTDFKIAMDYDLILRAYKEIDKDGFIKRDVSYMLTGGISHNTKLALKEFMKAQIRNKIIPDEMAFLLYYWGIFKNIVKTNINYNSFGV